MKYLYEEHFKAQSEEEARRRASHVLTEHYKNGCIIENDLQIQSNQNPKDIFQRRQKKNPKIHEGAQKTPNSQSDP